MAKKSTSTVAEKLDALHNLQKIDSEIDRIRTVRGELPLEVEDLEDEIAGLETRLAKLTDEKVALDTEVSDRKNMMKEAAVLIKKYEDQQKNVRNNREYDSISKEIEFQGLEIQLSEKKIKESKFKIDSKKEVIDASKEKLDGRKEDLAAKKSELDEIIAETQKDEESLEKKSTTARKKIEDRLLKAYDRLRDNSKNGLAVVSVARDACGGCFNKIPPQRQLDIEAQKKVIVCEHCGRILVEGDVVEA
jgi:predicted  nucleic acid-binding Zn-ribbon protein